MGLKRPFHRNYRPVKPSPQAGYSSWAYIEDREYARNAGQYVRAFTLIQNDLQSIFEYIEPSDQCRSAYSYRIHALLMRTCIEVEANFKAILAENTFNLPSNRRRPNMLDYRKIDASHHLSSYEVILPIWNGTPPVLRPFGVWRPFRGQSGPIGINLPWYRAYNVSKHDRQEAFKEASFEALIQAVAGLLVLVSAQFRDRDFSPGPSGISFGGLDYHPMEHATGSLFRIKYPDDWEDAELYDFYWTTLKDEAERFSRFDYDAVP